MKQDYNNPAGHRAPVVFTVTAWLPVRVGWEGEGTLIILVETRSGDMAKIPVTDLQ
jgi:hypothetical protein